MATLVLSASFCAESCGALCKRIRWSDWRTLQTIVQKALELQRCVLLLLVLCLLALKQQLFVLIFVTVYHDAFIENLLLRLILFTFRIKLRAPPRSNEWFYFEPPPAPILAAILCNVPPLVFQPPLLIIIAQSLTCYFQMWIYQVFVRKLTWYLIGVYIMKHY